MTSQIRLRATLLLIGGVLAVPAAAQTVEPTKPAFTTYEEIGIRFSGIPNLTHVSPWVGIAPAGWPDDRVQDSWFTSNFPGGSMTFQPLSPGTYEVRLYFSSDNIVQDRATFTVSAPQPQQQTGAPANGTNAAQNPPPAPPQAAPAPFPPPIARNVPAAADLAGSYDCYIYMGSQITYTQMGFTLAADGRYEWGYEQNGQYRGDGGRYSVQGDSVVFTGAMAESVGNVKPKAGGKPSIELVPNGETWKTMYCSPR